MQRTARWCVWITCYYSQLSGIMPYAYDIDTKCARKKLSITIYCIIINIISVIVTSLLYNEELIHAIWSEALQLHQMIFVFITLMRVFVVIATLALNWYYRNELIRTLQGFARLRRDYFKGLTISAGRRERHFDMKIIWKSFLGSLTDILMGIVCLSIFWHRLDTRQLLRISIIFMLTNILNVESNIYFYGILNINLLYHLLHDEVEQIVRKTKMLQLNMRQGSFVTQCCTLSDQLDQIAVVYRKLNELARRFNDVYQWPGAAIVLTLHLNNIAIVYYLYKLVLSDSGIHMMHLGVINVILVILSALFYYGNLLLFSAVLIDTLDATKCGLSLLQEQRSFPALDIRLERSFNLISIQLITDTFQFNLAGMFYFSKALALSAFSVMVLHSIFLVQYDIKNANK